MNKLQVGVNDTDWTPVAPPVACNSVALRNCLAVDLKIRTNVLDPATEDVLAPSVQELYTSPPTLTGPSNRFASGTPLVYAKSTGGSGWVMLTCVA